MLSSSWCAARAWGVSRPSRPSEAHIGIPGARRADHVVDADPAAEGGVPSMPAAFARPSDALGDGVEDDEGMGESKAQMT